MAEFQQAFDFMMHNEDATQAHAIVPDAPPGAHSISGINSAAYPAEYAAIAALPQAQRGLAVEAFYEKNFWNQWEGQLTSQDVANRVEDAAVNAGPGTAVRLLQMAVAACGHPVKVDGVWGPELVKAANACGPATLLNAFRKARAARYYAIANANPREAQYLKQWLARAEE